MVAEIEPPILPPRLYRYRSLIRSPQALAEEISSLRNSYLFCADFSVMNDPMEGLFTSSSLLRRHADYSSTIQAIKDRKLEYGIACFSETHENMLMWAHYAGNFSGICIEYSTRELIDGLPDQTKLIRVAYLDEPPRIIADERRNTRKIAKRTLSQKQYNWAYEREWRVLAEDKGRVHYDPERPIKAIFMGSRISDEQKDILLDFVRTRRIEVFQMNLDGYSPTWDEVIP